MATTLTLAQLLTLQDRDAILNILLAEYQAAGFPVTAWQPGGTERTRIAAIATAIANSSSTDIPAIASGGFVDFATGAWLQLKADQDFNLPFNPATATVGNISLAASLLAGPFTLTPGRMIAVFPSGNRYFLIGFMVAGVFTTTPQSLSGGASVVGVWQAENPGKQYNDPSNSTPTLSTPLPGVTLTNVAGPFSVVGQTGGGTGTLTLTGTPPLSHQYTVRIDTSGDSGVASWSYSIDGQPFVSAGTVGSLTNVGGTGANIALTNGAVSPSFVERDEYLFYSPGSWITTQGSDVEGDASLASRCRNRWPSLSLVPTVGKYQLWAQSVPTVGSQVTQVEVIPDTIVNNRVNIVVAGPGGALPPGTVAAIQTFISARADVTDNPVVVTPSTLGITYAGTITVAVNQLTAAQAAVSTAIVNYNASIGTNGTIQLSEIIAIIRAISGVLNFDITTVKINGSAADLTLGTSSTFVIPAQSPTLSFTYVTQ